MLPHTYTFTSTNTHTNTSVYPTKTLIHILTQMLPPPLAIILPHTIPSPVLLQQLLGDAPCHLCLRIHVVEELKVLLKSEGDLGRCVGFGVVRP
jgi:hypothetical protein